MPKEKLENLLKDGEELAKNSDYWKNVKFIFGRDKKEEYRERGQDREDKDNQPRAVWEDN